MNKRKEILKLLGLNENGLFEIIKPRFSGLYKLCDDLYVRKLNDDMWNSTQFQLCDLFNGAIEIKPIKRED